MKTQINKTLKELVEKNAQTANVFEKYQLDFYKNANLELQKIAKEKSIDLEELSASIEKEKNQNNKINFQLWPLDVLSNYIVKRFHKSAEQEIQELKPLLEELSAEQTKKYPEIIKVKNIFEEISGEMAAHMKKEEILLFPYIKKLVKAEQEKTQLEISSSRLKNLVDLMLHDHKEQLKQFDEIAQLTKNYQLLQEESINEEHKSAIQRLAKLQQDLKQHIHLEDDILFPKSIELGKKWTKS